ncbi:MAG: hypothetical protein K5882_11165, partial [Bacteroidales bacterium]|nr:hypothetical protein [Bacteroidales bacterium]
MQPVGKHVFKIPDFYAPRRIKVHREARSGIAVTQLQRTTTSHDSPFKKLPYNDISPKHTQPVGLVVGINQRTYAAFKKTDILGRLHLRTSDLIRLASSLP